MDLVKELSNRISLRLEKIRYDALDAEDIDCNVEYHDEWEVVKKGERNIALLYKRKVYFEPENRFRLEIDVRIVASANDKSNVDLNDCSDEDIQNAIDKIIGIIPSYMSALVSQITGSFTDIPVISPPFFIKKEE